MLNSVKSNSKLVSKLWQMSIAIFLYCGISLLPQFISRQFDTLTDHPALPSSPTLVHLFLNWQHHFLTAWMDITSKPYCYAGNTLKHTWGHTTPHRTKLPQSAIGDSANNLKYTLQTYSCTAQIQSDGCRSIKVSIILRMLSVGSSFAVSVASGANTHIYACKIYFFFGDSSDGSVIHELVQLNELN